VGETDPVEWEAIWRGVLTGTQPMLRRGRGVFMRLPGEARCKLCAAPFGGPAGRLMRLVGKGPWPKNPRYCGSCFSFLTKHRGGAEIDCTLLFADVRGSTSMAEQMRPSEVHGLMDRFFRVAAQVLVDHDAIVDRFVGDQTIGIFVPALTGAEHAARGIRAAVALLAATGHPGGAPWIPIGAGVHTGVAFVGCVGSETHVDLTALGDTVNIAARLASAAGPGEVLVTMDAARAARLEPADFERRDLVLKGKSEPVGVLAMRVGVSAR
jgi:adenylate cyclase